MAFQEITPKFKHQPKDKIKFTYFKQQVSLRVRVHIGSIIASKIDLTENDRVKFFFDADKLLVKLKKSTDEHGYKINKYGINLSTSLSTANFPEKLIFKKGWYPCTLNTKNSEIFISLKNSD